MNSDSRSALLEAIADLCQRYPHWRFGQLVANIAGWADQDIWDVEDEQLLTAAQLHLRHLGDGAQIPPAGYGGVRGRPTR